MSESQLGEVPFWAAVVGGHLEEDGTADWLLRNHPFHGDQGVPVLEVLYTPPVSYLLQTPLVRNPSEHVQPDSDHVCAI